MCTEGTYEYNQRNGFGRIETLRIIRVAHGTSLCEAKGVMEAVTKNEQIYAKDMEAMHKLYHKVHNSGGKFESNGVIVFGSVRFKAMKLHNVRSDVLFEMV